MHNGNKVPNFHKFLEVDINIKHFRDDIEMRYERFKEALDDIESNEMGGLENFVLSYKQFGIHFDDENMLTVKEWIPGAKRVSLVGDFNDWNVDSHPLQFQGFGLWYAKFDMSTYEKTSTFHLSRYKIFIESSNCQNIFRLSPWSRYCVQNQSTKLFESLFWNPPVKYVWKYDWPIHKKMDKSLRIYECHIGISSPEHDISTYRYFKESVLPHIIYLNYNAIQIMAVMEHAYYASFGYQVTSFFAPSSRFGTPDELKELIDECHKYGIRVLLDVIHSHACKNTVDGLNQFDGTEGCFFHDNGRGYHDLWDSRLFDYNQYEVRRFLLSNLFYYLENFRFDGFRFDGITSMLYHHHGINFGFTGDYNEYFGTQVDIDSLTYLQLATHSLRLLYPNIILIAEDVSGMPGLCRPVDEGGLGFDYRLAMAVPDHWIKLLKEKSDDDWNMWEIVWTLINRRHGEKHVAYAESHDQALVGDKTLAFWLMDSEMYWNMSTKVPKTLVIDRGIALHKMIRLITMGLGGEAYLNFIGNEFGHPEWLDFPRSGNGNSYHYARRQWNLVHDPHLRYRFLNEFDRDMQILEDFYGWLSSDQGFVTKHHQDDKIISFERGNLLFVFNFHPTKSYVDYRIPLTAPKNLKIVLSSDEIKYDGHGRVNTKLEYNYQHVEYCGQPHSVQIYIPSRVALVLAVA